MSGSVFGMRPFHSFLTYSYEKNTLELLGVSGEKNQRQCKIFLQIRVPYGSQSLVT
jgi:hypothetical protein